MKSEFDPRQPSYWADLISRIAGRTLIAFGFAVILSLVLLDVSDDARAVMVLVCIALSLLVIPLSTWLAFRAERKVLELESRLQTMSTVESLPSLLNYSFFMNFGERLRTISLRQKRGLSVITVEIQHFESLQGVFGKRFGATLLTNLAALIMRTIRAEADLVCRLHETEFAILLVDADEKICELIACRLLNHMRHAELGSAIVSTAVGCATLTSQDKSVMQLVTRARATRFKYENDAVAETAVATSRVVA